MRQKLIFLVLALLLGLSITQSRAACPQEWDSYTWQGSWIVNGNPCYFTVYYCFYLSPTGIFYVTYNRIEVQIPCGFQMVQDDEFRDYIYENTLDEAIKHANLPPCPLSVWNFQFKRVDCWKLHNDPTNEVMYIEVCTNAGMCFFAYKVCYDYQHQQIVKTLVFAEPQEGDTCSTEFPDIGNPTGQYPPDEEWTTYCFYWYNPCN